MGTDRDASRGDDARLFVAVRLPATVERIVAELPRPEATGVRWTRPAQWHVTLRFLGRASPSAAMAALGSLDHGTARARLDQEVTMLGKGVVCVRVEGLDDLAASVVACTRHVGDPPGSRPFVGHVTLARLARTARTAALPGAPVPAGSWLVREIELVRSDLQPDGARYTTVGRLALRA